MSLVTGSAAASLAFPGVSKAGLIAGEDLKAFAPCYIKSDGSVYECLGTSGSAASAPMGFTSEIRRTGQTVDLWGVGTILRYKDASITPGAVYYLSASAAGYLDTAPTQGDRVGVALGISPTMIEVIRADGVKWHTRTT